MEKPVTPEDDGTAFDVMLEMIKLNREFTADVADLLREEIETERKGSIKTLTGVFIHIRLLERVIADIAMLNPDSNCGRMISNPARTTDILFNGMPTYLDREFGEDWLKTTLRRAKGAVDARKETA
ncbi:hypothetical protein [Nisaea nitritireducens]|uniref:hypothetical protein n=1 Tax=Nisaea nitritireducens TaxID=568392 RepID=UPI00186938E7|nr:hypothetical protein [Nisaea nitritireducens]